MCREATGSVAAPGGLPFLSRKKRKQKKADTPRLPAVAEPFCAGRFLRTAFFFVFYDALFGRARQSEIRQIIPIERREGRRKPEEHRVCILCGRRAGYGGKPQTFFDITESWKSNAEREPSDLYRISTRLGGILFLLVGVAGMIVLGVLGW